MSSGSFYLPSYSLMHLAVPAAPAVVRVNSNNLNLEYPKPEADDRTNLYTGTCLAFTLSKTVSPCTPDHRLPRCWYLTLTTLA